MNREEGKRRIGREGKGKGTGKKGSRKERIAVRANHGKRGSKKDGIKGGGKK